MSQMEYRNAEQQLRDEADRRSALRAALRRSDSAVTFVELVDELGLGAELEELLASNTVRQIQVARARKLAGLDELTEAQ